MADMRSKQFPALPPARERRLRLVLPRAGDLRFRSLLPRAFRQRLFVHVEDARRSWYARFSLERRFIVMSSDGDLYTNTACVALTAADLRLLAMPAVSPGDLLRALDLAVCRALPSGRPHWEIVLVRWRNGMETWLPLEAVRDSHPQLLQALYVNSINSWAMRDRLLPASLAAHQTEVELWLFHKEFQPFYQQLRRRRAVQAQPVDQRGTATDFKPVVTANDPNTQRTTAQQPIDHQPIAQQTSTAYRIPPPAPALGPMPVQQAQRHATAASMANGLVVGPGAQLAVDRMPLRTSNGLPAAQPQQLAAVDANRLVYLQQQQRRYLQQQQEYLQQQDLQREQQRQQMQQQQRQTRTTEPLLLPTRPVSHQQSSAPTSSVLSAGPTSRPQFSTPVDGSCRPAATQHRAPAQGSQPQRSLQPHAEPSPEPVMKSRALEDEPVRLSASADATAPVQDRSRRRKRLARSHIDEDDDDDLPDLSRGRGPSSTSTETSAAQVDPKSSSSAAAAVIKPTCSVRHSSNSSKSRKRLRQSHSSSPSGGSDVVAAVLAINTSHHASRSSHHHQHHPHHKVGPKTSSTARSSPRAAPAFNGDQGADVGDALAVLDAEKRDAVGPDSITAAEIEGEIRCACGATSVGEYRGRWLQCTRPDCRLWQHADCVGVLDADGDELVADKYECSKCDRRGYTLRRAQARTRMVEWMFQCCESFNSVQLLVLINEALLARERRSSAWRQRRQNKMTLLMKAARHGYPDCVARLLDDLVVGDVGGVLATDALDRIALHHAAIGESVACCQLLLKHDRGQLGVADLNGVTPFQMMLRSPKLNHICIRLLRGDLALARTNDFRSNSALHYACSVVNESTAEVCRLILAAQPAMLHQQSGEGLRPPMILCRSVASGGLTSSAAAQCLKATMDTMLDVDVFALCLAEKTPSGWTVAHFAAAADNHEVVVGLGNRRAVDFNVAGPDGLTALHIAAMKGHAQVVRQLLALNVDIMAKDSNGVIPLLYAASAACTREFLHYKLTKHVSRLHRMLPRRQHQGLVRQWQRRVVMDPTCFNMLNDWCACDSGRIERMDGIFLTNPFMLRLDNKLEFIRQHVVPSLVPPASRSAPTKTLRFTFSSAAPASFWGQFVDAATQLEPADFRSRFTFAMVSSRGTMLSYDGKGVKLVLIRLAADLLRQEPGVLLRGNQGDSTASPRTVAKSLVLASQDELRARLTDLYVLGELMAHLTLFSIPTSTIFNFSPRFLDGVFSAGDEDVRGEGSHWSTLGQSFRLGFQVVLPSALLLLRPAEFRVLQNSASEITLNACAIDWSSAVEWVVEASDADKSGGSEGMDGGGEGDTCARWFVRLSTELGAEEQQLLLLFMTQTLPAANALFFPSVDDEGKAKRTRIRVVVGAKEQGCDACDGSEKEGGKLPFMCHKTRTLRLPRYPTYEQFQASLLRAVRCLDRAFMAVYD